MRVGVVADTHFAEFLDELPEAIFERLAGCELILHAGDVNGVETLEALASIAPVHAVRGDHDRRLPELPAIRELVIEGKRVVLVHGQRAGWISAPLVDSGRDEIDYVRGLPEAELSD